MRAGEWRVAPAPAVAAAADRRDHRTGRPEDDHQRAQLRRRRLHGRLRRRDVAYLGQCGERPGATCVTPCGARSATRIRVRQAVRALAAHRDALRASAWTPPARATRARRWRPPSPGALFDFALFFFHIGEGRCSRGRRPVASTCPKLESHLEARLVERRVPPRPAAARLPCRNDRATVLIETLPAAFEMDEILWELREHSAGLNCGRWDYIFSFIKTRQRRSGRGAARSVAGHHGAAVHAGLHPARWCAPVIAAAPTRWAGWRRRSRSRTIRPRTTRRWTGCAPTRRARSATATTGPGWRIPRWCRWRARSSRRSMTGPNQLERLREDVSVTAADLLAVPEGTRTEAGLRYNMRVGDSVSRSVAPGPGLRAALPPDGRRRDRRDLAGPGVAVAPARRPARRRARRSRSSWCGAASTKRLERSSGKSVQSRFRTGRYAEAGALFRDLAHRAATARNS